MTDYNIDSVPKQEYKLPARISIEFFNKILQIVKNLVGSFFDKFILEGCSYNGTVLTSGYMMWNKTVVQVGVQVVSLSNGEYLYLDSNGIANTTSKRSLAEKNLLIAYRDGSGTLNNLRFRYEDNELYVHKLVVRVLEVLNMSIDGDLNLEDLNLSGSLSFTDLTNCGSVYLDNITLNTNINMNSNNIESVQDGVNDDDGVAKSQLTTHASLVNDHIDDLTDIPTRNHSALQNVTTSDHHVKYTDAETRSAINDVIGSDGKADSDLDLDANDITNPEKIILDQIATPSEQANHGIIYNSSSDGYMYYILETGEIYNLMKFNKGFFCGGYQTGNDNTIDYINTSTVSTNATDVGNLTTTSSTYLGCVGGKQYGFMAGGDEGGSSFKRIDYIDMIAMTGNATDSGNLSTSRKGSAAVGDQMNGYFMGGSGWSDVVDFLNLCVISTNASDKCDLTLGRGYGSAMNGANYGFAAGGENAGSLYSNVIDYITFTAPHVNASDKGDLTNSIHNNAGVSGETYGYNAGGFKTGDIRINVIDYINVTTTSGNASDKGDLIETFAYMGGVSGETYGFYGGGTDSVPATSDTIQHINVTTTSGNATDSGDLTIARYGVGGLSGRSL